MVTYYNNPYTANALKEGQEYVFYGRIQGSGKWRSIVSPDYEPVTPHLPPPQRIVPLYPLTAGLTQKDLYRITSAALNALHTQMDWMPSEICARHRLLSQAEAIRLIHRPETLEQVEQARRRIIFE